jgi:hypothetical protein
MKNLHPLRGIPARPECEGLRCRVALPRLFSAIPRIVPGENLRKVFITNFPFQLGRQLKRARAALQFGTILPLICGICGGDAPTHREFAASPAAQTSAYRQARLRNFPEHSAVSTDKSGVRPSVFLRIRFLALYSPAVISFNY